MKYLNNERGAAFLLAMLVIALVSGAALMLMGQTMTASKQADTLASRAEARLAAEAGIDLYSERLSRWDGTGELPEGFTHTLDDTQSVTISETAIGTDAGEAVITFTSTGVSGERRVAIQAALLQAEIPE